MNILFFAALREQLGCAHCDIDLPLPASLATVRAALIQHFPQQAERLAAGRALAAINQTLINDEDTPINSSDEVAFFPPVTGG
jgi:molybdopterin synthase sulfur carrier subunit